MGQRRHDAWSRRGSEARGGATGASPLAHRQLRHVAMIVQVGPRPTFPAVLGGDHGRPVGEHGRAVVLQVRVPPVQVQRAPLSRVGIDTETRLSALKGRELLKAHVLPICK